jgi:rhomboid protease GluP
MKILLLPTTNYYVTPLLFVANTTVFIIMALQFRSTGPFSRDQVISWGANFGPMVREGQWFRLLTGTFIHGGLPHLLANLYGLLFAGMMLERIEGPRMTAAVYFVTGVIASGASLLMHPHEASAGASGAIFGLWGFMLIALIMANFGRRGTLMPAAYFATYIGLNLAVGAKTIGVDDVAHLVGLVVGLVLGAVFGRKKNVRPRRADT